MSDSVRTPSGNRSVILSVGTELTEGRIADSHGRFLSAVLRSIAFTVVRMVAIPDDRTQFTGEVREAAGNSDLLIITGGLGPTSDDLTREVVAEVAAMPLEFIAELWESIQSRMGDRLSETNRKQAYIPKGFTPIPNHHGTAPGFLGRIGNCLVVSLPGPPRELQPMFSSQVVSLLESAFSRSALPELAATAFLIPESRLEELLQRNRKDNIEWGTRVDSLRIAFYLRGGEEVNRRAMLADTIREAGSFRIREGEVDPASLVFESLLARGQTMATAESCTGGMIAELITEIPGSSAVIWGGWIVYANDAKIRQLGVSRHTLDTHGAVSRQTVVEMAAAACSISACDYGVAVSGIAGPDGGTPDKPVGTVWIGVACRDGRNFERMYEFRGNRSRVRRSAAVAALLMVEEAIRGVIPECEPVRTA